MRISIGIVILVLLALHVNAKDIYVSPNGNDSNSGTIESPVKSLQKAFDMVKGSAAGSHIWLRKGIHTIESTITPTAQHSGDEANPLVISAYQNEIVILNGGITIPYSKWRLLTSTSRLNRLPEVAKGNVYVAMLPESKYYNRFPSKSKYNKSAIISWNGYVMNEAQFPNKGYAYIEQVLDEGPTTRWLAPGESPAAYSETNPTGGKFTLHEQLNWDLMVTEFNRSRDMQIKGYFNNDWYFEMERIGKIEPTGVIQLLRYTRYGIGSKQGLPRRINIFGALCQLDQPGEWYFDKGDNLLYFWPVIPITSDNPVSIAGTHAIINSDESVENIEFHNLIFENFGDHGIRLVRTKNTKVLGCEFRSSGGAGVRLQGYNNEIRSCDLHDMAGGMLIGSWDKNDEKNLIPSNSQAVNNHIHHIWNRGYGGSAINGVGTRFGNNLVHDMNGALVYGTSDCIVEFNEFYNMGYEMGDWNPMYRGADFTSLGNQIRYNYIHHLMETPTGYPIAGIRNDDNGHGTNIHHNIFNKTGRSAVAFKGPANNANYNIILGTRMLWWSNQTPYHEINRADWDTKGTFMEEEWQRYLEMQAAIDAGTYGANEKDNMLGRAEIKLGKKFWENNTLWKTHFPIIDSLYHFDDPDRNPWMQCYDSLVGNVMTDAMAYPFHMHGYNKVDAGGFESLVEWLPNTARIEMPIKMTKEEIFKDFDNGDISINDDFDEIEGFVGFNTDTIGLFIDEYRTEMPDKKAYRKKVYEKYKNVPPSGGSFDYDLLNDRYDEPEYLILNNPTLKRTKGLFRVRYSDRGVEILPKDFNNVCSIEIYSVSGKLILFDKRFEAEKRLEHGTIKPGIYMVHIYNKEESQVEKVVVSSE